MNARKYHLYQSIQFASYSFSTICYFRIIANVASEISLPFLKPSCVKFLQILKGRSTIDGRPGESLDDFDFDTLKKKLQEDFGKRIIHAFEVSCHVECLHLSHLLWDVFTRGRVCCLALNRRYTTWPPRPNPCEIQTFKACAFFVHLFYCSHLLM